MDAVTVASLTASAMTITTSPATTSTRQPIAARRRNQLGTISRAVVLDGRGDSHERSGPLVRIGSVGDAAHPSRPAPPLQCRGRHPPRSDDPSMTALDDALEAHLDATHEARIASYKDFLRIPSISGIPAHADDCRRAATWLADALRTAGIEHVEVAETGGHPVVYGDWLHARGRADDPRLRPLRRAAGRPARPVDVAAVRAGRASTGGCSPAAPPTTRARSTST